MQTQNSLEQTLKNRSSLIPLREFATMVGLHYQTLYKYARAGNLPHLRIGNLIKVDPARAAEWLKARTVA